MDPTAGFLLLLVLVSNCVYTNARSLEVLDIDVDVNPVDSDITSERKDLGTSVKNDQFCTLCEEFAGRAISYLSENKTQTEIINILHKTCSQLHYYEHQCIVMVDYYASLFFLEIASIQPNDFCEKTSLCEGMLSGHLPKHDNACTFCHHLIIEVLTKLKDPDTQLEIIETLLKGCTKMENYVQECKKLVFQYGPIILANTERFIEKTDICSIIYGCKASSDLLLDQKLMVDA